MDRRGGLVRLVYLSVLGVPKEEVFGMINVDSITAIYSYEADGFASIINLNNNRQFRSKKYITEIVEILREVSHER